MIKLISVILMSSSLLLAGEGKYFTKKGKITFYSETAVEKIEATNNRVTSVLDASTGKLEFSVLITAFEFEKALMQEHFNENYMESEKFPKATFKGKIDNMKDVSISKDGTYDVTVSGDLTMHGVTKKISEKGKIKVKGGVMSAESTFKVALKDYNINVPSAVGNKLAEVIEVRVNIANYELLKK